jgi:hypothetical protein
MPLNNDQIQQILAENIELKYELLSVKSELFALEARMASLARRYVEQSPDYVGKPVKAVMRSFEGRSGSPAECA